MGRNLGRRAVRATGIFAAGTEVFITEIEETNGKYKVRQAIRTSGYDPGDPSPPEEQMAENVKMTCLKNGIDYRAIGVIYARTDVFWYMKTFPALPKKDLDAVVKWDLEVNCPYPEGQFWHGYHSAGASQLIAAVDETHGAEIFRRFRNLDMDIVAMFLAPEELSYGQKEDEIHLFGRTFRILPTAAEAVWKEEQILSLYAALGVLVPAEGSLNFLPGSIRTVRRDWSELGKILLCLWLTVLAGVYFVGVWRIHRLDACLDELAPRWDAKIAERERMDGINAQKAEIARADRILAKVSAERQSWYYIFYTLGALTADDVYLTEVDMKEDPYIHCQGSAADYESLVNFLELLEENQDFFRERPRLEHFEADSLRGITFSLRLKF